jgi:hypothetical protein
MVAAALARLRRAHDAVGALAELDRYDARFPTGVLRGEARAARVDALLTAGRPDEARRVLADAQLGPAGRDRELRLLRAELTAETDCVTALGDYQLVLAQSGVSGRAGERALWGRAACRSRLGDQAGARADLADYLRRFPRGSHAAAARARLTGRP